jgi:hypothetical protein
MALSPLFLFACTSSNSASGGNPAACPTENPLNESTCYSNDDGGTFSCSYPCGHGETGSIGVTCDGTQWQEASNDCKAVEPPAPTGPIACGNATCDADEYCSHECCDETPCTTSIVDADGGGCPAGSHAVPAGGGECAGGCIADEPECLSSDTCQKGSPPSGCTDRHCDLNCD